MQKKTILNLGIIFSLSSIFIFFGAQTVFETQQLINSQPDLVTESYFITSKFLEFYLLIPLIITSALIIILAPGLLIISAHQAETHIGELVLKGFALSFLLQFFFGTLNKILFGVITTSLFLNTSLFMLLIAYCYFIKKKLHFNTNTSPTKHYEYNHFIWLFLIAFLFVVLLFPYIFWHDLSGDGFEILELGRSLSTQLLPVFPNDTGTMGLGAGMLPMAYPVHWFIMLFGATEVASRLPMVLYLIVLFSALTAWIEYQSPRRLKLIENIALLSGIACYSAAIGLNATYHPYLADMASPAATDTLAIVLMIAAGYFLWTQQRAWFLIFALLGFLARPTFLLFLIFMGIGIALSKKDQIKSSITTIGMSLLLLIIIFISYEVLYASPDISSTTKGSSIGLLERFRFITLDDFKRFVYVAAPTGILPALSILFLRWHDPLARCITVVTVCYFSLFYFPAFVALHHFIPVMVLPLLILWRTVLTQTNSLWPAKVIGLLAIVFLYFSLPQRLEISHIYRELGRKFDYRLGDIEGDFQQYRTAINGYPFVYKFFNFHWEIKDIHKEMQGGAQIILYSASSESSREKANYLIWPLDLEPPSNYHLVFKTDNTAGYVKDRVEWEKDLKNPPKEEFRSMLYSIPEETLFPFEGIPAKNYSYDLSTFPIIWRVF